ncbi:MAG: hypothetical protein OEZ37_06625 [Gemmatimonadota bacterium]|nr:hypothetical protein [Gemmatimonadota bacterium]
MESNHPRSRHPHAWWVAFGIALVVHLVALFLYPRLMPRITGEARFFAGGSEVREPEGMKVIALVALGADQAEPARPAEEDESIVPELDLPPALARPGIVVDDLPAPPGTGPRDPTAAERLRPEYTAEVIWGPVDPALLELTLEERLELELAGRLESWRDSVNAVRTAEEALLDWTHTDDEGRRWGVSPGQLHLGDVTVPLPFTFGTSTDRRDYTRQRQWEWEEVERGKATGLLRDSWKDRAQAIRERRDRERARDRPPPDTSGVGRR